MSRIQKCHTNVHDEERSGRPSVQTDDLVQQVDEKVRVDRRFTISSLAEEFPNVSRTTLFRVVTEKLGYHKVCARWVPKILTDKHKNKRMASGQAFLTVIEEIVINSFHIW